MKRLWTVILVILVVCAAFVSLNPVAKQMISAVLSSGTRTYIGWVLEEGLRGSNQWHITTEKVKVVGKQIGILNPNSLGPGNVFSDYYPPGTQFFAIPGFNPKNAIALGQLDGSYVLAIHASKPPSTDINTCEGWVTWNANHSPGHYKVTNDGSVKIGRQLGTIGSNFMSAQFPNKEPVYTISGVDPKTAIAVRYPDGIHAKAVWIPEPTFK